MAFYNQIRRIARLTDTPDRVYWGLPAAYCCVGAHC